MLSSLLLFYLPACYALPNSLPLVILSEILCGIELAHRMEGGRLGAASPLSPQPPPWCPCLHRLSRFTLYAHLHSKHSLFFLHLI